MKTIFELSFDKIMDIKEHLYTNSLHESRLFDNLGSKIWNIIQSPRW